MKLGEAKYVYKQNKLKGFFKRKQTEKAREEAWVKIKSETLGK